MAGVGMVTGKCWPRSCSWPRRAARASNCRPRRSGRRERAAHRRFSEWTKGRVWAKLYSLVLDELGARGELDWSRCAIDSVNMRAMKGGDLTGPNPVDRGKYGSKIHLITERTGLPLSVGISAANLHDSQALIPLVKGTPPIRSRRGPRRRKPGKLHADKGYDSSHLGEWLRQRGITHRIARKGVESLQRLGRHRWTIERTMAWLADCRCLHRRYERKADHFLAFTSIACTLICYHRLGGFPGSETGCRGTSL
ncbi:IS5 family transposase [Streptomyces capoamus]|uniref:IS5 family transposase n=1 Tax=Streptomyces capoamus TaxID=68183 RepID=UPI0027952DE2|nr:IS5 family transposase [Streptomyces capoamus]